jgi:hypothetical protein
MLIYDTVRVNAIPLSLLVGKWARQISPGPRMALINNPLKQGLGRGSQHIRFIYFISKFGIPSIGDSCQHCRGISGPSKYPQLGVFTGSFAAVTVGHQLAN